MKSVFIPFFVIMFLCATLFGEEHAEKKCIVPKIQTIEEMLCYLATKPKIGYTSLELKEGKQSQTLNTKKYFFSIKAKSLEDDATHNFCIMGDLTWRIKMCAPKNVYRGKADLMLISRDTGKIVFRNIKVKLRVLCPT